MIPVLTIGTGIPLTLTGRIYSIHDHAINIEDSASGRLLSIIDREVDLTALSVLSTARPAGLSERFFTGDRAEISDRSLSIATRRGGGARWYWNESIPTFDGRVPTRGDRAREALAGNLPAVRAAFRKLSGPEGLSALGESRLEENPYARRAASVLCDATGDDANLDPEHLGRALAGLIGLGPGFTPSGDDFTCGALLAVYAFGWQGARFPVELGPVRARLSATTRAGATLVGLACDGSFPNYLIRFLSTVLSGTPERAVLDALTHGATSGSDAVSGYLWMGDRIVRMLPTSMKTLDE